MKQTNGGFTLIELVVVIVILGILAAVAVPKFFDLSGEAETAAAQGVAGSLASASSVNFAAKKVSSASAITLNQANVCTSTILGPMMQGGIPAGFTIGGTGDCTAGTAAEFVTCTVTKNTKTANAQILCAR
ncbi:MAG: prepilin-type N-terminal cleavage/methylation domain-containing protein [Dechloromonas sp.]|nr:MAG: prepilin-type N-terminal cleavage/methylation domain-containing protein [Dechloromonas sp.]